MKRTKAKTGKSAGQRSFASRHQLGLMIAAMLLLAFIAVVGWIGLSRYSGPAAWVSIPQGSDAAAIKDTLTTRLGSVEGNRVYALWRLSGGSAATARGSYHVDHGQLSLTTAWRLHGGRQTPVRVTWTDVRTLPQLAEKIAARMDFTAADFLAATDSVLGAEGWISAERPAAFIPDTYEFYATTPAARVVRKLLDYRNRFWTPERMARANALGLTPAEAATLASIVEEESLRPDERPVIARLYLNRLAKGMPLQADPTVKFATGRFDLRRITAEHLAIESPYNTYRHRGLPPGPIRIASAAAIEAVLSPADNNYLYMCAKEDFSGRHNFSASYDEHRRNAARYHAALNRKGIHE